VNNGKNLLIKSTDKQVFDLSS